MSNLYPFVSIIIPTYKDWDRLKICLNALNDQSYPYNKFEVVVINNDTNNLPPYKINNLNVKLINEKTIGSYAARNAGIKIAKGDIFAFTDSDCIPSKNWLREGIKKIISTNQNSIVAGSINIFPKINNNPNIFELFSMNFELNQFLYVKNKRFASANVFIKREVIENLGNFNSSIKSGADFELASRAEKKNILILYCKESMVLHPARSTFKELNHKAKRKIGGILDLNKSILISLLSIFKSLTISVFGLIKLKLTLFDKLKLLIVIVIYFFCKFFEIMNLSIWKSNTERR